MSNGGDKDWTQENAWKVYNSVSNIDSALNGRLAANIRGANVTFMMGDYHSDPDCSNCTYRGWTYQTTVTFYTIGTAVIRQQNVYHEFGHVVDNVRGLENYSGDLSSPSYPSWVYFTTGIDKDGNPYTAGHIDRHALITSLVADPNGGTDPALQHDGPVGADIPTELWADAFANYVAGNINVGGTGGAGAAMYSWVSQELKVNFAAP